MRNDYDDNFTVFHNFISSLRYIETSYSILVYWNVFSTWKNIFGVEKYIFNNILTKLMDDLLTFFLNVTNV